jgi:hypothetical protein
MRVVHRCTSVLFLVSAAALIAACAGDTKKNSPDAASLLADSGLDGNLAGAPDGPSHDGSDDAGFEAGPMGPLTISPTSIDLGILRFDAPAPKPTVTITANRDISLLSVSMTGGDLVLDSATTCKTTLAAGDTCVVVIEVTRTITGTIVIRGDGEAMTIPITAVFRTPAKLAITPQSAVLIPGSQVTLNVGNIGGEPVGPLTATITGTNAEEFVATPTGCELLAPAATCGISVAYVPTTPLGPKSATLVVTGPAPDFATTSASLTGEPMSGGPNPLVLTPFSQDFGSVVVGATSPSVSFTLKNTSRTAAGPIAVASSGSDFLVTDNTCATSGLQGAGSDAGASTCTFDIAYRPGAPRAISGWVAASDSAGISVILAPLTNTSVAPTADASITDSMDADTLDASLPGPLDSAGLDIGAAPVDAGMVD